MTKSCFSRTLSEERCSGAPEDFGCVIRKEKTPEKESFEHRDD